VKIFGKNKKVLIFAARFERSGQIIDNIERSQRGKKIEKQPYEVREL
jgi:hypothetical protein